MKLSNFKISQSHLGILQKYNAEELCFKNCDLGTKIPESDYKSIQVIFKQNQNFSFNSSDNNKRKIKSFTEIENKKIGKYSLESPRNSDCYSE
mmetsp:Transcript_1493/g.1303  ORF Transcript_1493/g.1303 Transcript_1493/m.1303 type:complete len:93 (-) Transcript_1493:183-461(-)